MTALPFPWIFIALAVVVDAVGLFYLWRRRNSELGANYRADLAAARSLRIPLADRRRRERRAAGRAALLKS